MSTHTHTPEKTGVVGRSPLVIMTVAPPQGAKVIDIRDSPTSSTG